MNSIFLHCLLSKSALTTPGTPPTSASVHNTTSTIDSTGTIVILVNTVIEVFLCEWIFSKYHISLHCSSMGEETSASGIFPIAHI